MKSTYALVGTRRPSLVERLASTVLTKFHVNRGMGESEFQRNFCMEHNSTKKI